MATKKKASKPRKAPRWKMYYDFFVVEGPRCIGEVMLPFSKARGITAMKAVEAEEFRQD